MRLYLMRHGPAEDRARSGLDRDRALTPEGRAVVKRVAAELALEITGVEPSGPNGPVRIAASPYARAAETADLVREALAAHGLVADVEHVDDLMPDDDVADDAVASRLAPRVPGSVLVVVGHQPGLERFARRIAKPTPPGAAGASAVGLLGRGLRTAMVVAFELSPGDLPASPGAPLDGVARLASVVDPADLDAF